jgi:hypothetical protein
MFLVLRNPDEKVIDAFLAGFNSKPEWPFDAAVVLGL